MYVSSCSNGFNFSNSHFQLVVKKPFSEMEIDKNHHHNEEINNEEIKIIKNENLNINSPFVQFVPLSEKSIALLDAIERKNINKIRNIIRTSILDKPTLFRAYSRLLGKKQIGEIKISQNLMAAIYTKLILKE